MRFSEHIGINSCLWATIGTRVDQVKLTPTVISLNCFAHNDRWRRTEVWVGRSGIPPLSHPIHWLIIFGSASDNVLNTYDVLNLAIVQANTSVHTVQLMFDVSWRCLETTSFIVDALVLNTATCSTIFTWSTLVHSAHVCGSKWVGLDKRHTDTHRLCLDNNNRENTSEKRL